MKRTPGRPRLDADDRSTQICLTVTSRHFDQLDERAQREGVSIPELIRRDLRQESTEKKYPK
jgi:hypothetical protein